MPAMNIRGSGGSIFDESIYGPTSFGKPGIRKDNVFSVSVPMSGLGETGADYYEKAKRYYANYTNLVARAAKVGSAQARSSILTQLGRPDVQGTMAYIANSVDDDIRTAEQWSPPNTYVWDISRRQKRVDALKDVVTRLEPVVSEAERVHGVMPDAQTQIIYKEVIVEKPAPPPPKPLPADPKVAQQQAQQPTPTEKKILPTATTAVPQWVWWVGGAAVLVGLGSLLMGTKK